jgi:hypothetical protein
MGRGCRGMAVSPLTPPAPAGAGVVGFGWRPRLSKERRAAVSAAPVPEAAGPPGRPWHLRLSRRLVPGAPWAAATAPPEAPRHTRAGTVAYRPLEAPAVCSGSGRYRSARG